MSVSDSTKSNYSISAATPVSVYKECVGEDGIFFVSLLQETIQEVM